MPLHGYSTDADPPTWWDHIFAHPFELTLAAGGGLGGVFAIIASISQSATVSPSLDDLPELLAAAIGLLLILGGIGIIRGLFDDSPNLMVGWTYERGGMVLAGGGWAAYGFSIFGSRPAAVLSWGIPLLVVTSLALRFEAIRRRKHRMRESAP